MNGYLDRLAAHAQGLMPVLQPRGRSRFEPEPYGSEPQLELTANSPVHRAVLAGDDAEEKDGAATPVSATGPEEVSPPGSRSDTRSPANPRAGESGEEAGSGSRREALPGAAGRSATRAATGGSQHPAIPWRSLGDEPGHVAAGGVARQLTDEGIPGPAAPGGHLVSPTESGPTELPAAAPMWTTSTGEPVAGELPGADQPAGFEVAVPVVNVSPSRSRAPGPTVAAPPDEVLANHRVQAVLAASPVVDRVQAGEPAERVTVGSAPDDSPTVSGTAEPGASASPTTPEVAQPVAVPPAERVPLPAVPSEGVLADTGLSAAARGDRRAARSERKVPPATSQSIPADLVRRHVVPALAEANLLTPGAHVEVVPQPPARARPDTDFVTAAEPSMSQPPVSDGPPQVHVTIGRVTVVRAAPPTPLAPPPPRHFAAPDHEAYLARRRRQEP